MANLHVNQKNSKGDNIFASDNANIDIKNITIKSIASQDLADFATKVLILITRRDFSQVNTYLQAISTITGLDRDCIKLITILRYRLAYAQAKPFEIEKTIFTHLLNVKDLDPTLEDIIQSSFLAFMSKTSIETAIVKFSTLENKGCYTNEVYYELIADDLELDALDELELIELTEHEVCAYVRFFLRKQNFEKAFELSTYLHKEYNNQNSQALMIISKSYMLYYKNLGIHRWTLPTEDFDELLELIEEIKALHSNTNDFRTYRSAAIILANPEYFHEDLAKICEGNFEESTSVVPEIEKLIVEMRSTDDKELKEAISPLPKKVDQLSFTKIFKAYKLGLVSIEKLQEWYSDGVHYSSKSEVGDVFIELFLTSLCSEAKFLDDSKNINLTFNNFLNHPNIDKISVFLVTELGQLFNKRGLSNLSCNLLKRYIPDTPLMTPLLETYCESLMVAEQFSTFEKIIGKIKNPEDSRLIVKLSTQYYSEKAFWTQAKEIINRAINKYPNDLINYYWLATVIKNSTSNVCELKALWDRMPAELFNNYTDIGIQLLVILSEVNQPKAELVITEWFIDNPNDLAIALTNFHFSTLKYINNSEDLYQSSRCKLAVTYTGGKREFIKLIVDNQTTSEYILDSGTPLAMELVNVQVGDSFTFGVKQYTVKEKLSPAVGAFRAAIEIRDAINSGTDCFHQLTFNEDDVEGLIKQIEAIGGGQTLIPTTIDGQTMPLLTRINKTHGENIVRGAYSYLMDKESNAQLFLFNEGIKENNVVILDILSLVYLSITGMSHGLISSGRQILITRETSNLLDLWLKQITSSDYQSMSVNDGILIFTDSSDISRDDSLNNLKLLFESCNLIEIENIDFPAEITRFKELFDVSHYSTLKASVSRSIPILCFDNIICSLYKVEGLDVYNTYELINELTKTTSLENNRGLICHVEFGLPFILSFKYIIDSCGSRGLGQYYASELLSKYPNNYDSNELALYIFTECIVKSISSKLLDYDIFGSSIDWTYTEKVVNTCCRLCIGLNLDMVAEEKIGLLTLKVCTRIKNFTNLQELTLKIIGDFCVGHFLDCRKLDSVLWSQFDQ